MAYKQEVDILIAYAEMMEGRYARDLSENSWRKEKPVQANNVINLVKALTTYGTIKCQHRLLRRGTVRVDTKQALALLTYILRRSNTSSRHLPLRRISLSCVAV